jgi:rare lipoprotein A (peptidoglycan hydrolase)
MLVLAGLVTLNGESFAAERVRNCTACAANATRRLSSGAHRVNDRLPRDSSAAGRRSGEDDRHFTGLASYYAEPRRLASDHSYEPSELTAAHRTLPFGTRLQVSDPKSGRSVIVTINDRGPFVRGRVLDLSLGAARALGMIGRGVLLIKAAAL